MNKQTAGGIEMSDKILPCPFCGCETIRVHKRTCDKDTPYNSADRAYPLVRCYGCGASAESDDWTDIDTAINRWNRRAPAVPVMGELTDRQLFNVAFNLSAEFGPEFTQANKAFAMAVIEQYRHAMSNTSITQAEHDAKDARIREPLPCPFCGVTDLYTDDRRLTDGGDTYSFMAFVTCLCGCDGPEAYGTTRREAMANAVGAWNSRAAHAAARPDTQP